MKLMREWYEEARRSSAEWRATYHTGLKDCMDDQVSEASEVANKVVCKKCSRVFRRESEMKHPVCETERQKAFSEQQGVATCPECLKLF